MSKQTVVQLTEKLEAALAKVEKIKKTLERHKTALAKKVEKLKKAGADVSIIENYRKLPDTLKWNEDGTSRTYYWEACEVESKADDIYTCEKKLAKAVEVSENWRTKLDAKLKEEKKASKEQAPQVLIDYLNEWKRLAIDWNLRRLEEAPKRFSEIDAEVASERNRIAKEQKGEPARKINAMYRFAGLDYHSVAKRKSNFAGALVTEMISMSRRKSHEEAVAWLEETLEVEKQAKLVKLIARIEKITGLITEAEGLKISGGELNGYIKGEKGNAKVQTIGAGGYNIQCFHFRTLVTEF